MKLKEILVNCNLLEIEGNKDIGILDLTFDSRKVGENSLFFAIKGTQVDGHDYIDKAVAQGAKAMPTCLAWRLPISSAIRQKS